MLAIVIIAYFIGSVMRFNIQYLEPYLSKDGRSKLVIPLEVVSHPTLGVAYMISVAFYLKLLSVFTMKGFGVHSDFAENTLTTGVLIFIALMGWFKGLHVLEVLEKYAVNLKLAIIGSLVIGFYAYNIFEFEHDLWFIAEHNHFSVWESFRKLLGILIIVQGFETSRYMGALYTAETRIKTMRYAQLISGLIYVSFVLSAIILFNDVHTISETAVIDLCKLIAPILPPLLIVAAIMSQFSAAVADSIGSSGLISEASKRVVSVREGILITVIIAIFLVWLTNTFEIIVIASKAFAIYYGMQCLIAARLAYQNNYTYKTFCFLLLFVLMLCVTFLGIPIA